jgi:hypothetical protein
MLAAGDEPSSTCSDIDTAVCMNGNCPDCETNE